MLLCGVAAGDAVGDARSRLCRGGTVARCLRPLRSLPAEWWLTGRASAPGATTLALGTGVLGVGLLTSERQRSPAAASGWGQPRRRVLGLRAPLAAKVAMGAASRTSVAEDAIEVRYPSAASKRSVAANGRCSSCRSSIFSSGTSSSGTSSSSKSTPAPVEPGAAADSYGDGAGVGGQEQICDIVQFDSAIYYAVQSTSSISLEVLRLGSMHTVCAVDYVCHDGTAIAGNKYAPVKGTLVFEDGDVYKDIEIPIVGDERWNPTQEFTVELLNPQNCELGLYLHIARIKVINENAFPTNRFADTIRRSEDTRNLEVLSGWDLFVEFVQWNLASDELRFDSAVIAVVDQLKNLYFLLTTYLLKYIADDVLVPEPQNLIVPGDQDATLVVVGVLYALPFGILNALDYWKAHLGMAERVRGVLQSSTLTKFLYYSESAVKQVQGSELSQVMAKDVNRLVDFGFMNIFKFAKNAGTLVVSSYFISQESPEATLPLAIFAGATFAFSVFRYEVTLEQLEEVSHGEARVVDSIQELNEKYRVFCDYHIRPRMVEELSGHLEEIDHAQAPVTLNEVVHEYFPNWLTAIMTTGWIVFGGDAVVAGTMGLGTFVGTINVFKEVGDTYKDIYSVALDFSRGLSPMQHLTRILNFTSCMQTSRMVMNERRRRTREQTTCGNLEKLALATGMCIGIDAIPLEFCDVSFRYPCHESRDEQFILKEVSFSVPQGSLVAIVGEQTVGKNTLVELLGQVLLPTEGHIYIPSHLRVLHVSTFPMFLDGSLWSNLCVGRIYWTEPLDEMDRAMRICRRLYLSDHCLDLLEATKAQFLAEDPAIENNKWATELSDSDRLLINLARAFIYNPEVMVLSRPTVMLPKESAETVLLLLREFCECTGVELPASTAYRRRRRTVFLSCVRKHAVDLADFVLHVHQGGSVDLESRVGLDKQLL